MSSCVKHPFERAAAPCRTCAELFCTDCLVYAHGDKKPPACVPCALVAAGVRRHSPAERKQHKANRATRPERWVAGQFNAMDAEGAQAPASTTSLGRSGIGVLAIFALLLIAAVPLVSHFA